MILTVILRNDGPMIFCGDSPSHRSVQIELTSEQCEAIKPRHVGTNCGREVYEAISMSFIEPNDKLSGGEAVRSDDLFGLRVVGHAAPLPHFFATDAEAMELRMRHRDHSPACLEVVRIAVKPNAAGQGAAKPYPAPAGSEIR